MVCERDGNERNITIPICETNKKIVIQRNTTYSADVTPTEYDAALAMTVVSRAEKAKPLYQSAEAATKWLQTIYWHELSVIFALPVHLALDLHTVAREPYRPASFVPKGKSRVEYWWELVQNREKRRLALATDPAARIYEFKQFMVWLTWIRLALNLAWLVLITEPVGDVRAVVDTEVHETGHALFLSHSAKMGWYCFVASLGLHFLMYAIHRMHLMRLIMSPPDGSSGEISDAMVHPIAYIASHFSVVNFALDIPGWGVPSVMLSRYIVLALNFTAGVDLVATITLAHPLEKAWGCYAPGTPIKDLDFGMCPAFSTDPQDSYAQVCTQPGVRCGFEELRWRNIMGHEISVASTLLALSAAIYLTSAYDEVKYYMFEYDKAVIRSKKQI